MERDLGITGDDGVDLMNSFSDEFEVDLSEFDISKYFSPEGCNPFAIFFHREKILPLKIKSLVQAAIQKKWIDRDG
jgi:hypothetical protein